MPAACFAESISLASCVCSVTAIASRSVTSCRYIAFPCSVARASPDSGFTPSVLLCSCCFSRKAVKICVVRASFVPAVAKARRLLTVPAMMMSCCEVSPSAANTGPAALLCIAASCAASALVAGTTSVTGCGHSLLSESYPARQFAE